ncbi:MULTISPECIES: hypothetical protein [unclassified Janthinobacterium]|uniref:hypothetical protein n=1 Tax=unclassified Janthinobacterium TaxID=2610881 RepID=UPI0016178B28|nr:MULTISPECIES: hypothetical protein [unclassified Janthinobacterium]MBB5610581.1 hypothetical protein [Janthinobacterium sp. S3T4]MBB5615965.1 hypothetical protein [Janthinobacterium sp. S3M3]
MNTATLRRPTGDELEREIEDIESRIHDENIRTTIQERMARARQPGAARVSHGEAFAQSRARLMDMLTAPVDG